MSGTIVVDRIESDASYASSINIASPLVVSNTTSFANNVGIGTTSPTSKLHVAGTGTQGITVERTDASTAGLFQLLSGNSTNVINASTAKPIAFEINNAELMRITSDGYLRMASGTGGIQFGGDTAAANALDDYEEGTWTPQLGGGASNGTLTYTNQQGGYTKVGNMVTCWGYVTASSTVTGGSGTLQIYGLPFTAATGVVNWYGHGTIGYFSGLTSYGTATNDLKLLGPDSNTTYVRFHTFTNTGATGTNPTQANVQNNTDFYVGFSYRAA